MKLKHARKLTLRSIGLLLAIGLTGCAEIVSPIGVCGGLARPVAELRGALEAHPETPGAVGEAGTDVVLGYEAGCNKTPHSPG